MLYQILLSIGALGVLAQALMGLAHHGSENHGHHGHGHHGHHGSDHGGHGSHGGHSAVPALWNLLSPLRLFAFCLGAGAAGMLLAPALKNPLLTLSLAVAAGFLFYQALVRPLLGFVLRFASRPAETLDESVAREATAASRFDANGQGIVTLIVDGQQVRLLAHLDRADGDDPTSIRPGERLLVTDVDTSKNACRVLRL